MQQSPPSVFARRCRLLESSNTQHSKLAPLLKIGSPNHNRRAAIELPRTTEHGPPALDERGCEVLGDALSVVGGLPRPDHRHRVVQEVVHPSGAAQPQRDRGMTAHLRRIEASKPSRRLLRLVASQQPGLDRSSALVIAHCQTFQIGSIGDRSVRLSQVIP